MSSHDLHYPPATTPASSRGLGAFFFFSAPAAAFAGAFLGCLATLQLSAAGVVPALASALVTAVLCGSLLASRTTSLFSSEFFPAIYGGTFAGMTPVLWLSDHAPKGSVMLGDASFVLLPIVSGLAFCIVAAIDGRSGCRVAGGYGGRSGAIAAVASLLFLESARLFGAHDTLLQSARAGIFDVDPRSAAFTCAACMIGICATLLVLRRPGVASAGTADRTFLASTVALTGLAVLHLTAFDWAGPNDTPTLDAFYAGCFVGTSSPERLRGWIQPLLGAIVLTIVLVQVRTLLPGVGGGLGLAAFATVAMLVALSRATIWLTNGVLPRAESLENATQASANGPLLRSSTRAGANVWFEPAAAARSFAITGSLVIGWLVLTDQLAWLEAVLDTAASAQLAKQPAITATANAVAADTAVRPGTPLVNADLGAVTAVSADPDSTALSDSGSAMVVTADLRRADSAEGAAANIETVRSVHIADAEERAAFQEFMRWRAARPTRIAQARPQPVKRSRDRSLQMEQLTRAGSSPQTRAGRARQPDRPN